MRRGQVRSGFTPRGGHAIGGVPRTLWTAPVPTFRGVGQEAREKRRTVCIVRLILENGARRRLQYLLYEQRFVMWSLVVRSIGTPTHPHNAASRT